MRLISRSFFVVLFYLCGISASSHSSNQWEITSFNDVERLPRSAINAITEDADGTMFFGTWGSGVWSLNQSECRIFDPLHTLTDDCVKCLTLVANDLWVGTSEGWAVFDGSKWTRGSLPDSSGASFIKSDPSGTMLMGSNGGVYRVKWDESNQFMTANKWSTDPPVKRSFESDNAIEDVVFDRNGTAFVSIRNHGIYRFRNNVWSLERRLGPGSSVLFFPNKDGSIWAVGGSHLLQRDADRWILYDTPLNNMTCIAPKGRLIGTTTGLWTWDNNLQWHTVPLTQDLDLYIQTIYPSKNGDVWVGCREGLYRLSKSHWNLYQPDLPEEKSSTFTTLTAQKQIACIDGEGTLFLREGQSWRPFKFDPPISDPFEIWTPSESNILIATATELFFLNIESNRIDRIAHPKGFHPKFGFIVEGDPILFSSTEAYRYKSGEQIERLFDLSTLTERTITSAAPIDSNTFWLGMDLGLALWREGKFEWLPPDNPVSARKIRAILHDRDGNWWFGTSVAGVFVYDGVRWTEYSTKNGLGNNYVSSLFQSSDGAIWVGSRNGEVSSFRDDRWIHFHNPVMAQLSIIRSIWEDIDGTIGFLSENKQILHYSADRYPPDTVVENISQTIAYKGIGVFSVDAFDSWNLTERDRLQYSWRIRNKGGTLKDWSPYNPSRVISIPVLPPGYYQLEVRAADVDRNVDPTPATAVFRVMQPIWKEKQFTIPVALLTSIIFILLWIRWRYEIKLMRSEEKYRALVENAKTIILKRNVDGIVTFWNECGYKLLGVDANHIEKKSIRETIFSSDETLPDCIAKQWGESITDYQCGFQCITPNVGIDRNKIWIAWNCHPIEQEKGRVRELLKVGSDITLRKNAEDARDSLIEDLQNSLAQIKTLQDLLPICCSCKKIRDDSGYWNQLEDYLSSHSQLEFTHSFCPECAKRLYGYESND